MLIVLSRGQIFRNINIAAVEAKARAVIHGVEGLRIAEARVRISGQLLVLPDTVSKVENESCAVCVRRRIVVIENAFPALRIVSTYDLLADRIVKSLMTDGIKISSRAAEHADQGNRGPLTVGGRVEVIRGLTVTRGMVEDVG